VRYIHRKRRLKIIAVVSGGNRYVLAIEASYGKLRTLLLMIDAIMITGYGWLVQQIRLLSAGTDQDRSHDVLTGLEEAVEKLLAYGTMPGQFVMA